MISCMVGAVGAGQAWGAAVHRGHVAKPAVAGAVRGKVVPRDVRGHDVQAARGETVSVTSSRRALNGGGGMMRVETAPRAVQTVSKQYIEMRSPTSNALDLIQTLPSVNVTQPDSYGMEGGQIQSRGLTDLDMGLMLDGAPAAAAKYLSENIDSENLEEVSLTPGSAATSLPVMSAAGGVLQEQSVTPSFKSGGMMDFSYGTNNLSREFLRLESGEIGHSGVRGFVSFSNTHTRSWIGSGINNRRHLDFGVQKDWSNGSTAKAFVSWNNENFVIDNYPTAQEFYSYKHTGQGYGRSADPANANYWKNNNDHWNQVFLTAPVHVVLPAKFSFDFQPYFSYGTGYDASPLGAVTDSSGVARNAINYFNQNATRQVGVVTKLNYQPDAHNTVSLGYWYENNYTLQSYPQSFALPQGGAPNPTNPAFNITPGDLQDAGYEIHSLFIEDTAQYFDDRLTIHGGFKFVMANTWNKDDYGRQVVNRTEPLPQLQIGYKIDEQNQVYVNVEGDYRQPSQVDLGWLYTDVPIPKNQYSIKEELGWRHHNRYFMIDASFFNYNVTNRIVDQYIGMNNYSPFSIGNQQMRGFDFMIAGHSFHGISPYVSVEYLHASQDTNVFDPYQGVLLHSKGTQAIMAPHVMANFGLTYTYAGFFGNASVHYTGPQSVSVAGDQRMPGYVTNTLSLGYHFKPFGFMKSPTFKLNFTNLTGAIERTGAMGAVYSRNDPSTVWSGSGASYTGYGNSFMVVPRFTMAGTVSTSF